jgi:hypothetical protein
MSLAWRFTMSIMIDGFPILNAATIGLGRYQRFVA